MARDYGIVETTFWQNAKARKLSPDALVALLYVYSSPHSTAAGCYVLPLAYAAHDLQWPSERVTKAFRELSIKPFLVYDMVTEIVLVPGWFDHNKLSNLNVSKHVARLILALPDCPLKARVAETFREVCKFKDALKELSVWTYEAVQGDLNLGFSNGSETLSLGLPSGTGTGTGTGQEPEHGRPSGGAGRVSNGKGSRITEDWSPSAENREFARGLGIADRDIDGIARQFARYWSGPDAKSPAKKDWDRTWANWVEREAPRVRSTPGRVAESDGLPRSPNAFEFELGYKSWKTRNIWPITLGPKPDEGGCALPPEIRAKVDAELTRKEG